MKVLLNFQTTLMNMYLQIYALMCKMTIFTIIIFMSEVCNTQETEQCSI